VPGPTLCVLVSGGGTTLQNFIDRIAAGDKESGCTVHLADDTYDTGPIVLQKRVPVLPGDTPETLAARVFAAECEAYPEAIHLLASGAASARR